MSFRFTITVLTTLLLANVSPAIAQNRLFDTESSNDSDVNKYLLGGSIELFDRSSRPFEMGTNFGTLGSNEAYSLLGISIADLNIYGAPGTSDAIVNAPDDTRFIVNYFNDNSSNNGLLKYQIFWFTIGNGMMTRVDVELEVDQNSGRPIIESADNSGAVHGFSNRPIGTDQDYYVSLDASVDAGYISGNTNSRVSRSETGDKYGNTEYLEVSSCSSKVVTDATRSGEIQIIGVAISPLCQQDLGQI